MSIMLILSYVYGLLRGSSLQNIFWIISQTFTSTMVVEKFQTYGVNITGKCIESKNWIWSLNLSLPKFLSLYPKAEGNYPFLSNSVLWKSVFSPAEREEMEQKKWLKLKHEIYSLVFHMLHKSLLLYTFFHI